MQSSLLRKVNRFTFFILFVLLSLPAYAHEEEPIPFRPAPIIVTTSIVIASLGLLLLIGLFAYRAARVRQHRQQGGTEPLVLPYFSRALYGLFALTALSGLVFSIAQRGINAEEHEQRELRGNSEEAPVALNELLAKTPSEKHFALLKEFSNDPSPGLRFAAISALGETRQAGAAEILEQAFRDNSAAVRERALELLPGLDKQRGKRLLRSALRDEDTTLRETALRQLLPTLKKTTSASQDNWLPHLFALLEDPNLSIVVPATVALSKLTGNPWRARMTMSPQERDKIVKRWLQWKEETAIHHPIYAIPPPSLPPTRRDPAPALRIQDIEGRTFDLAAQKGRITLLNFWGTWCPPCRQEIPELKKVDEVYRSRGVDMFGLTLSEPDGAEGVRRFCQQQEIRYRQALCTRQAQRDYGEVTEVPVTVLIDSKGAIRYRWEGPRDFATFKAAIERVQREP